MQKSWFKFKLAVRRWAMPQLSCAYLKRYWKAKMTHWHDPIVEEVRRIREQQAAELDYDLKAIFERARQRQKQSKRKTVSFVSAAELENHQAQAEVRFMSN
jgi:hypothetical protein